MKRACLYLVGLFALSPFALGQTVQLYLEDYPNAGGVADLPVSNVGWANDVPALNPNRLAIGEVNPNDGIVWAWEPAPGAGETNTTAFYTSTALDTGSTGPAFTNVNPSAFSGVEFHCRIRDTWDADNMATRFAVRMESGNWYVSTTVLPIPFVNGDSVAAWTNYSQVFTTRASAWLDLTVSGNGSGTGAVIGAPAAGDLTGEITGAGFVVQHWTDDGTHQFDDFQVRATPFAAVPPSIEQHPPSRNAYETETVTVSVVAAGTPPLSYQWRKSGSPLSDSGNLSGSTTDQLSFSPVILANAGSYDVVVTNIAGAVTSAVAVLTVDSVPAELLYEEVFPWAGSGFISSVGWVNAIGSDLQRMYEYPGGSGNGHVYAYEPGAATTAFYTTTEEDTGSSGLAFRAMDPEAYPFVTLEVEIEPSTYNPDNVEAYMAVKMAAASVVTGEITSISAVGGAVRIDWNGGGTVTLQRSLVMSDDVVWDDIPGTTGANSITAPAGDPESYFRTSTEPASWYVSASPLPVNPTTGISTHHLEFTRAAAAWNTLTIEDSSATIGGGASGNLSGDLVGAGIVFVHSGAGTLNFDNFRVTTNEAPSIVPIIEWLPQSLTVYEGAGASFAVATSGTPPFDYEWSLGFGILVDGGRISGATTDVLRVMNVSDADEGEYTVQVSNDVGSDDSFYYVPPNMLTVDPVPAALLYAERFPFVGPGAGDRSPSQIGWAAAVSSDPARLFKISPNGTNDGAGAVFAYEDRAGTSAFYTTVGLDTGFSGLPFAPLAFGTTYPTLELAVDIAPTYAASNVTARVAVQIDADWYVSSSTLPVPETDSEAYGSYTQQVTTAAAAWNELTLTGSGAVIGGGATGDLTGSLNGAGVVVEHTGSGTYNIGRFEILQ